MQRDSLHTGDPALRGADDVPPSFHRGGTMHDLFADCAGRYPGATAVVHHESRLTYSELDALSDHYAEALERAGVGPGDLVPIVMRRSPALVGLMLAVLKRGAAYSVMDPRWPADRLAGLVARLRARLVVTETGGTWAVPAWAPPGFDPTAPARRASPVSVGPDDPCAILFTSGSTGEPKGVICTHRGTVRLFDACDWMPAGPGVAMPQVSAPSWDGFALDGWGPLLTGGMTVLVDEPVLVPEALSELRDRDGVNAVFLTSSLFNMLVDEGVQAFAGIATVLIGGEKASPVHARRLLENHPGVRLINVYGPTECGVIATTHTVVLADCDAAEGIPLGRAVPYTGIYVLDGTRVCDEGEVGEICLAGGGLAAGYLDDAELTARRFVDVEVDGVGQRLYRTGDLGHVSGDGSLCFDGRMDLQVKVHGFRIEPEEIEVVAAGVAGVTMSAVVPLRRDGQVDALALFYASPQAQIGEADVRGELTRQLPGYLVPRRIRRLDTFPLLTNGKLDRRLLEAIVSAAEPPAAPAAQPAAASADDPRGATETAVAGIFAEILAIASVSRVVSFFDLGGDSLAVGRVCARLEQATGAKVTASQVFRTPTVEGLAAWLDASRDAASHATATPRSGQPQDDAPEEKDMVTEPSPGTLVALTPMQAAMVPTPLVSEVAWWIDGPVDVDALELAAGDVQRRHQSLYARYIVSGPAMGHAMVPAEAGAVQFHRLPPADTDAAAAGAVRAVLAQPLQIEDGEVWRCAVVRSTATGYSLFGVFAHQAAFDGWSASILAADLSTAYAARVAGTEPLFAAPTASLAEYEAGYRQQVAAIDIAAQRQYWRGEFHDLQPSYLPGRTTEPAGPVGPVASPAFTVEPAHLLPWEAYGRSKGMTAFVWIAAAYTEALIRAGAAPDLGLMVTTANRGNELFDRTITCRIGPACLRPNGPTRNGQHLLARMHEAYTNAMGAMDLLLNTAEVSRAAGLSPTDPPRLQAMPFIVYQDPIQALRLGDAMVTLAPEFGPTTPEFAFIDLRLHVQRRSAGELRVTMVVRSDLYPAELASDIGRLFLDVIRDGPAALEQRTAG